MKCIDHDIICRSGTGTGTGTINDIIDLVQISNLRFWSWLMWSKSQAHGSSKLPQWIIHMAHPFNFNHEPLAHKSQDLAHPILKTWEPQWMSHGWAMWLLNGSSIVEWRPQTPLSHLEPLWAWITDKWANGSCPINGSSTDHEPGWSKAGWS